MKNRNIKKDFIWNSLGSALHAFNSLFFLIIVTRINGLLDAGYFSYAFIISNIFLTISCFGGKGYQVTDVNNEFDKNTYISFRIITTIIATIIGIILFLFFNYETAKYLIIMLLIITRSFESMSDVFHAIMQKNGKLYKVGISLFFKNLLSLIAFLIIDLLTKNILYSSMGWMFVNILFLFFVDIKIANKLDKRKFKFDLNINMIFKKCLFYFLYNFIIIFIINIPRYFIDFYLTDELQGIYGIITMPATMTVLLCQFILQPFAVRLSKSSEKNKKEYKAIIKKISLYILFVSVTCIIGSYFLGIPLLNLIYGIKLDDYKWQLIIVMLGACFYAYIGLLSLIMVIKRKNKEQFYIYLISTIISVILSWLLIKNYELLGGVISYSITMAIILVQYLLYIKISKINN